MVFAALPECQTGEPPMNPIVTIHLPGRGLAQGETVEPADERGFVRADMRGNIAVTDGATVWVGKPVRDAYAQPDLFIAPPEKPTQEVLL